MIGIQLTLILMLYALQETSYAQIVPFFCTDLSKYPYGAQTVDVNYGIVGNLHVTTQRLWSEDYMGSLKNLVKDPCFKEDCKAPAKCFSEVRTLYLQQASINLQKIQLFNFSSLNETDFVEYVDRDNSAVYPELRALFDISCLHVCGYLIRSNSSLLFKCHCPSPCYYQRACPFEKCTAEGLFQHQFRCDCEANKTWSPELHTCVPDLWLQLRSKNVTDVGSAPQLGCENSERCDPQGTQLCLPDEVGKDYECYCKPHYSGENCSVKIDACSQHIQNPYLPGGGTPLAGDVACNVGTDGNECIPFLSAEGDLTYRCICNEQYWGPEYEAGYDNCMKRRSLCDSIVCSHGRCVTNERGNHPHCICSPGYRGDTCNEWVGQWSEWSPWDKCTPACGDVRYSVRSRDCLSTLKNPSIQCTGAAVEYVLCAEHPCARSEGSFVGTYFALRQNAIASSVAAAAIACAVVSGLWAIFTWRIVSRLLYSIVIRFGVQKRRTAAVGWRESNDTE